MSRQGHKDAPQKLMTPEEIQEMCPILNTDIVLAGLFNPGDGHIDPYSLTQALATGARRNGAQLRVRAEVTGLQRRPQGGWDVHTKEGRVIRTLNVVNAAGFWAREVGSMAGLDLPLVPVEHQYIVTAPIPDVKRLKREIPVLRHLDGSFYLRQEREDCLVVGPYESPDTMKIREDWLTRGVPPGFGKELFPSDVEKLSPHLDAAMELVPSLKTASVKSVVCGPITYTPDALPMVGPTLLPNMWLAVGFRTNWHEAVKREWELVMNNIGVIDLSPSAKFILSGDDSFKFLQYVTANVIPPSEDVTRCRTVISHCLTSSGKVHSELTVTSLGEGRYLLVSGGSSELHDLRWLEDHARRGGYHVTLSNVTDSMGCLGVAGPRSGQLLDSLCEPGHFDNFPFLSARKIVLGGVLVTALRISYTGELGWELYCDQQNLLTLYNRLMEAGQEHGAGDFGSYAMNVLRMEKGFRMWGSDMNKDTSLLEAGLDFVGRTAVLQEKRQGLQRHLVTLAVNTDNVDPMGDESVHCAGKVVGSTTSGCFSPALGDSLAFAYVPPYLTTPGTKLQVNLLKELRAATVLPGTSVMKTQPMRERGLKTS
uniref:Dimethylglycine dehydrogenase n=1 Tax=Timema cristinae TaxID=61476 RepID=A0A7R9H526_TIMCR|nr:unnamed protein product [Timema cristinae]